MTVLLFQPSMFSAAARLLALALVLLLGRTPASSAKERPVTTVALPAEGGTAAEARTVIDAPAERVAQLAGDPAVFAELLPAAHVRLLGTDDGGAQIVQLERHEPWPVGVVRWTEAVRRRRDGAAFIVERMAQGEGYFKRLEATWAITPLPGGCAEVTYRVSMELRRWVPAWVLRRGNQAGMLATLERLRRMSER